MRQTIRHPLAAPVHPEVASNLNPDALEFPVHELPLHIQEEEEIADHDIWKESIPARTDTNDSSQLPVLEEEGSIDFGEHSEQTTTVDDSDKHHSR